MIPRARATGRALGYQIFYRLPVPLRRRLVRLAVPKYVVGAVTLVKDAEATGAGHAGPRPPRSRSPRRSR